MSFLISDAFCKCFLNVTESMMLTDVREEVDLTLVDTLQ